MTSIVLSADGLPIAWSRTGAGSTALVFVHGWLGRGAWWNAQQVFADRRVVVQLDLGGHGDSGRTRATPSVKGYADDLEAVVRACGVERVVLVGHSMSGANVLEAGARFPELLSAIVLVDTLKNVEQQLPPAQVEGMLAMYRADFRGTLENAARPFFFSPMTPPVVSERLMKEFLEFDGTTAAALLSPFYGFDTRAAAERVKVPVRGIHSDLHPSDLEANRRHFRDFSQRVLKGCGHYPMLEVPEAFNAALGETLEELKL